MKRHTALLGAMVCVGMVANAWADCEMRPTTEKEIRYSQQTLSALKEALPAAPAGWTQAVREPYVEKFVCQSDPEGNFDLSVSAAYTYQMSKQESDQRYAEFHKVDREIERLRELPPEVAQEHQGWLDKMSVANRASNRAYKEGDKKLASRLSDEADGYSQKGKDVRTRYLASVQSKVDQLEAEKKTIHYGDQIVNVRLIANEHGKAWVDPQRTSELTVGNVLKTNKTGLKVQVVRVIVEGDMPERDVILKAIEHDHLARLVQ